jgi:hypothetical protein
MRFVVDVVGYGVCVRVLGLIYHSLAPFSNNAPWRHSLLCLLPVVL